YGIKTGGLPTRSMNFRWMYWRGAAAMMREHGLWGVGASNFGRHFTHYKPVECPEDVQDPHSWIVRAATEWGWLGLIGMLTLWVGISVRLARAARVADADWAADTHSRTISTRTYDQEL